MLKYSEEAQLLLAFIFSTPASAGFSPALRNAEPTLFLSCNKETVTNFLSCFCNCLPINDKFDISLLLEYLTFPDISETAHQKADITDMMRCGEIYTPPKLHDGPSCEKWTSETVHTMCNFFQMCHTHTL